MMNSAEKNSKDASRLCRYWVSPGSCKYGANCQFVHGEEELRSSRLAIKPQISHDDGDWSPLDDGSDVGTANASRKQVKEHIENVLYGCKRTSSRFLAFFPPEK